MLSRDGPNKVAQRYGPYTQRNYSQYTHLRRLIAVSATATITKIRRTAPTPHMRGRSAQCTSATPNAIAIQGVIILASCEMTEGITPLRGNAPVRSPRCAPTFRAPDLPRQ